LPERDHKIAALIGLLEAETQPLAKFEEVANANFKEYKQLGFIAVGGC